jgi:hypothetical protein
MKNKVRQVLGAARFRQIAGKVVAGVRPAGCACLMLVMLAPVAQSDPVADPAG